MSFPSLIPIRSSLSLSLSFCLDLSVCCISSSLKLRSVIWQPAHVCTHTHIYMHENAPDVYFYWVLTCALKMPGCALGLLSFNTASWKVCSSAHFLYTERRCVPVSLHECVHTHSWPSHSCVRASSECRSGAHPGRTVSPALWIPLSALPSVCRTASHTCIAPLRRGKESEEEKKEKKNI